MIQLQRNIYNIFNTSYFKLQMVIFNLTGNTLEGGSRWNATSKIIDGNERSLEGGLRYSLQGDSYQAYRDFFTWDIVPSVTDFQQAIVHYFNAWTIIDPVSGFGTDLSFFADLETPTVGKDFGGIDISGAEINSHLLI